MRITPSNILRYVGGRFINAADSLAGIHQFGKGTWEEYIKSDPCEVRKANYPLDEHSIVVDVGAYKGEWAAMIFACHSCFVDMYEPQPELASGLRKKFRFNKKMRVNEVALSNCYGTSPFYDYEQQGSLYYSGNGEIRYVTTAASAEAFKEKYPDGIDLLKVNAEGAEYAILRDLFIGYEMKKIKNILVAFHSNVPGYIEKRNIVRRALMQTHKMVWGAEDIFESWERLP